jgi:hypothetical protein
VPGDKGKARRGDLRHVLAVACRCAPSDEHIRANVTRQRPLDQEAAVTARIRFIEKDDVHITQDHEFTREFGLTQLGPHGNVILMFKVSGDAGQVLTITTNNMSADPPTIQLDPYFKQPRAWVEVLDHGDFAEAGNKLTMKLDHHHPHGGQVTVSDVVIFYVIDD